MSSSRNVVLSVLLAVIIAFAVIGASVGLGVVSNISKHRSFTAPSVVTITTTESSFSTVTNIPTPVNGNSGQEQQTSTNTVITTRSNAVGGSSGSLAVLMTDPPTIPDGVTAVYATYSDLAIHVADAGNDSDWYVLQTSGQINLLSIINFTQTLSIVNITNGQFNGLRFNLSSVQVTYGNVNYSADIVTQQRLLVAWIPGGISISSGQTSAAVIDLTPTVMLLGTSTNPTFAFYPAARAYALPAQSVSVSALHLVGSKQDITHELWWVNIVTNSRFDITGLSLAPSSLSVTVTNTGKNPVDFQLAAVTSTASLLGGFKTGMAAIAATSELFVVEPNASLVPLTVYDKTMIGETISSGGYILSPRATVTFTYSGAITIGILQPSVSSNKSGSVVSELTQKVIPGDRYIVTVESLYGTRAESILTATSS